MDALARIKKALKRDSTWRKFVDISKNAVRPEFNGFIDEMKQLHKTRAIRQLGNIMPTGRNLAEAALKDQAVRSRCTEICMDVMASANYLDLAINNVRRHVLSNYDDLLVDSGLTRVTEKRELVDNLFVVANARLQQLNDILDIADLVIKDVDQGGWSLARGVQALEIAVRREGI